LFPSGFSPFLVLGVFILAKSILILKKDNPIIADAFLKCENDEFHYNLEMVTEILYDKAMSELCEYTSKLDDATIEEVVCNSALMEFDLEISPLEIRRVLK